VVTRAVHGYDIGAVEGPEFHLLNTRDSWPRARRLAQWYAAERRSRAWASRDGQSFEPLVFERASLDADHGWFPYRADAVLRHAPRQPGIYVLRAGGPVCIGCAEDLQDRLRYHLDQPLSCPHGSPPLEFSFKVLASAAEREERVAELITWWGPPCNQWLHDERSMRRPDGEAPAMRSDRRPSP
jgi:hypothetical protein